MKTAGAMKTFEKMPRNETIAPFNLKAFQFCNDVQFSTVV